MITPLPTFYLGKLNCEKRRRRDCKKRIDFVRRKKGSKHFLLEKMRFLKLKNTLNTEIETLKAQLSHVQSIDQAIEDTKAKLDDAIKSKNVLLGDSPQKTDEEICYLSELTLPEEYRLRDYLDDKEERRVKHQHQRENAERDVLKSQTEYELINESRDVSEERRRAKMQRRVKLAISLLFLYLWQLAEYAWRFTVRRIYAFLT